MDPPNCLKPFARWGAFFSTLVVLTFASITIFQTVEYHGIFAPNVDSLPKTGAALLGSDKHKLAVVIDYPFMYMTGMSLKDYHKHGIWASAGKAHHGSVVGEVAIDIREVHKDGALDGNICKEIREAGGEFLDNWHKFVPGCAGAVESDGTAVDENDAGNKGADWDLTDEIDTMEAAAIKTCYDNANKFTQNEHVQMIMWGIFLVGWILIMFLFGGETKGGARMGGSIFIMLMLAFFAVSQGMQMHFSSKLHQDKDGCFQSSISTAIDKIESTGSDFVSIKAYDWNDLKKYAKGKKFHDDAGTAAPTLTEIDPTAVKYGHNSRVMAFGVITVVFATVGFIFTLVDMLMEEPLNPFTSGGFQM